MRHKPKINLQQFSGRINHKQNMTYRADKISVVLRMKSLLFTDLKEVWEYDFNEDCFIKLDLQERIQELFQTKPVSHSFINAVMDFLPYLEAHQVRDYGKAVYSEYEEAIMTKQKKSMNEKYKENEAFVKDRINYNNNFNQELREKYEIISIEGKYGKHNKN